ncbi:hypothetical protein JQ615_41710 [Bradyrhizobium jicamae]|uniref:DUF992 domain-containing protein n=1 Tax=Bradyrhizobium jicamae TaxID=280332 RepID=A0ABS5FZ36_9BRAD|nr:hypothetical protein [Bradyrhizobium jicamae]MBR0801849.1 hypothetical protein [Bradyrhizobium jicamae]
MKLRVSLCVVSFLSSTGLAIAEPIGRYECSIVGQVNQQPIGDKEGHRLVDLLSSCVGVDGLFKGATYSASSVSEWDGMKGTYVGGTGVVRSPGGLAVNQITEGVGSVVMKDGKPAGSEGSGKGLFKFASGTLAALSGKSVRWEARPIGFNRYSLEVTTDE